MSTLGFVRSLVRSRPASLILSRTAASTAVTAAAAAAGHDDPRIYRSPHRPVDLPPPTRSLYDHLFPTAAAGPARTTTTTTLLAPDLPVFVDSASAVRLTRAELERSSALLGREVLDRLGLVVPATAAASSYSPLPPSPTSTAGRSPAAAEGSEADGPTPAASDQLEKPPAAAEPPPTVGLFLANGLAWPVAFLACQRAGLPTALFAASLTPTELAHQLRLARPGLTLTSAGLAPTLTAALELVDSDGDDQAVAADRAAAAAAERTLVLPSPPTSSAAGGGPTTTPEAITELAAAAAADATFPTWPTLFDPPGCSSPSVPASSAATVVDAFRQQTMSAAAAGPPALAPPAVVCFSSGTEGLSKGVETTHANLTALLAMVHPPDVFPTIPSSPVRSAASAGTKRASGAGAADDDNVGGEGGDGGGGMLAVLPFSHIYGLFKLVLLPLVDGFRAIVVGPKVDLRTIGTAVERFRPSCAILVPPILIHFAQSKALDRFDLSSLDWLLSGAAPLGKELAQAVEARFASQNLTLLQGFGLTETSPVTHILQRTDARAHPGSIGRLIPNVEARLVNEQGMDVVAGEGETGWPEGELWIRGPNVMKGYLGNPLATEATFARSTDGGRRWLKTGDIAAVDPDGYFYIIDRRKELIKYNGHQVAPAELEALLLTHPQVADVGVIGVLSAEEKVEVPRAYVVLKPEAIDHGTEQAFAQAAVKWVQQRVAPHKYLRGGVHLIDQIPKSASGKILRRRLRDLARDSES